MKPTMNKGGISLREPLRSERETFVVRVLYRQNNTWQGEVLWAEQNEKRYFRSALELMELMDSAMERGEGEEENEKGRRNWDGMRKAEAWEESAVSGR